MSGTSTTTPLRHLIDGALVEGSGRVEITSPSTEEVVAVVPSATSEEGAQALAAARRAFDEGPWPRMSAQERSEALHRLARALRDREKDLVHIAVHQTGAVQGLAEALQTAAPLAAAERYADLAAAHDPIEHVEIEGPPMSGATGPQRMRLVQRVPAGVVVGITPFNYPLMMNVQKVFPALAVGCTVILKPTPWTCWDAAVLAEAAVEAGLPDGVLQVLLGAGADVGEQLVVDPRVDVVSFTGSTATGRRIMALASDTVKRVVLELGGKSAHVVLADADLEAFFACDPANLRHAGQGCGQLTRVLVHRDLHDQVVDRLAKRMRSMRVGPTDDPASEVGPVASRGQYDRVMGYIQAGIDEGAELVTGGRRPEDMDRGHFIEPTLFANVDNRTTIAQEEIFGPVLVVIPFDDEAEAIRLANDSIYGINGSVWTRDIKAAWRVATEVRTGNFGINCLADVTKGPHGGFKQTGIGREWWQWSLDEYVELRGFSYVNS